MSATSTDVEAKRTTVDARLQRPVRFVMITGLAMLATIAIYAGTDQRPTPTSYGVVMAMLLALFSASIFIAFKSNVWFLVPLLNLGALLLTPTVLERGVPTWLAGCIMVASLLFFLAALTYTETQRKVMPADVWGPPQAFWKGPLREEQSRSYPRLSELEYRVLRHPDEASVFELMLVADLALRRPNDLYAPGDYGNVYSELFRREAIATFKQALTHSFTPLYTPQGPIPFVTEVRRAEFKGFLATASDLAVMRRLEELTVAPASDLSRHERFGRAEEVQELEQELSYRDLRHLYTQIKKKVDVEDEG